ncbi:MAG: phosphatidylglycerophosphatase A [Planctomycetota bacterium]|nr:phosphatidylglycerophosphatase A [Planctomycetota bacterium]
MGLTGLTVARKRLLLITTFGLGRLRPAPGTWGSLPPVLLAGALIVLGAGPAAMPAVYHGLLALVIVVFSVACVRDGDAAEVRFGKKDPGDVVADETAGQSLALVALPTWVASSWWEVAGLLVLAFLLFRAFDILKPWPARELQDVPGGWGILLDDLVAGVMALVIMQLLGVFAGS